MADLIERDAVLKTMSSANIGGYITDKIMSIPAVNRWIPCSERLPEDRDDVLTYDVDGNVRKCEYDAEFKKFRPEFSNYYAMDVSYVTHWMPLPEPPESEVQGR